MVIALEDSYLYLTKFFFYLGSCVQYSEVKGGDACISGLDFSQCDLGFACVDGICQSVAPLTACKTALDCESYTQV